MGGWGAEGRGGTNQSLDTNHSAESEPDCNYAKCSVCTFRKLYDFKDEESWSTLRRTCILQSPASRVTFDHYLGVTLFASNQKVDASIPSLQSPLIQDPYYPWEGPARRHRDSYFRGKAPRGRDVGGAVAASLSRLALWKLNPKSSEDQLNILCNISRKP